MKCFPIYVYLNNRYLIRNCDYNTDKISIYGVFIFYTIFILKTILTSLDLNKSLNLISALIGRLLGIL